MSDSRYMAIFINFDGVDRDILIKQIKMLKERFRAHVVLIVSSDDDRDFLDKNGELFEEVITPGDCDITDTIIAFCKQKHIDMGKAMYIGKLGDDDSLLKESGIDVKDPVEMAESYKKAFEMLQSMVSPIIKK